MSLYSSLPRHYDSIFNPPLLVETNEIECHSCHEVIDTDFDATVYINGNSYHAECGADVWAEARDLPEFEPVGEVLDFAGLCVCLLYIIVGMAVIR